MTADSTVLTDLLRIDHRARGMDRVSEIAALRVGGIEAPDAARVAEQFKAVDRAELAGAFAELLRIDVMKLMAEAWARAQKVRVAVRDSIAKPDADLPVDLSSHTIEASQQPRLVLSFGGADWCHVEFRVTFSAVLKSATLVLRRGELVAVQLGRPAAKLKLSCEGVELKEYARELELKQAYRLPRPLSLERLAAGA